MDVFCRPRDRDPRPEISRMSDVQCLFAILYFVHKSDKTQINSHKLSNNNNTLVLVCTNDINLSPKSVREDSEEEDSGDEGRWRMRSEE